MTALFPTPRADWPTWFAHKNAPGGQRNAVLRGLHPVGLPLLSDASSQQRCGTCANLMRYSRGSWLKCKLKQSGSAATDMRAKWPACVSWTKAP